VMLLFLFLGLRERTDCTLFVGDERNTQACLGFSEATPENVDCAAIDFPISHPIEIRASLDALISTLNFCYYFANAY